MQVRNPRAAVHPRRLLGSWRSGLCARQGPVGDRDALERHRTRSIRCSPERDAPLDSMRSAIPAASGFERRGQLAQHESPQSRARKSRAVPRVSTHSGDDMREGLRATPVVVAGEGDAAVVASPWSTSGRTSRRRLPRTDAVIDASSLPAAGSPTSTRSRAASRRPTRSTLPSAPTRFLRRRSNGCGARQSCTSTPAYAAATGASPI